MWTFVLGLALATAAPADASVAKSRTFRGLVTCSVCWHEADRSAVPYGSAADIDCAIACAKKDVPAALAVWPEPKQGGDSAAAEPGEAELYLLAGKAPEGGWIPWMAHDVEVVGQSSSGPKRTITVTEVRSLAPPARPVRPTSAMAPLDLVLGGLDGKQRPLAARGQVAIVNYWASWCGACRHEMPVLAAVATRYKGRVAVIAAAADGDPARVLRFRAALGPDVDIRLSALPSEMVPFGYADAIPLTAVVDRAGKVAWSKTGAVSEKELLQALDAVLAP